METYLGIDTSCYTTSLAIMDGEGNLLSEARILLKVPSGGRGLAQNEAVFQHITNLPLLFEKITGGCGGSITGVSASTRPRPVEGSYMPVFRVAESFGKSIALLCNVPIVETTHQEGHLAAGLWSGGGPDEEDFLAVHISGGTTEVLKVKTNTADKKSFDISLLGSGADLNAGQLIDRIGVKLGLPFPAGSHLEKLARDSGTKFSIPSSVNGYKISFSGPEAAALRMIEQKLPGSDIAWALEGCIAASLEKVLRKAIMETGIRNVLVVGGVAANQHIRERLTSRLEHRAVGGRLFFASPALSSDNAVGVALIGIKYLKN